MMSYGLIVTRVISLLTKLRACNSTEGKNVLSENNLENKK